MATQDRYALPLQVKTLPDGRLVYKPCRPVSIPTTIQNITLTVGPNDRMDIIANNVYDTSTAWWKIAAANEFHGSLHFLPGTLIKIPPK